MIIAVDFDGTLCGEAKFPQIGEPNKGIIEWCKKQRYMGHKLILWTCREGIWLTNAVTWCKLLDLEFDAVNDNVPELQENDFGKHKIIADIYLDDKNLKNSDIKPDYQPSFFVRGQ